MIKPKFNNSLIKYNDYLEDINKENEREKINKNNKTTISHKNIIFNKERKSIFEDENINKYIPETDFNFILDLSTMSFIPSNKIKSSLKLNENLKNEAISKINSYQEEIVQKKKNQIIQKQKYLLIMKKIIIQKNIIQIIQVLHIFLNQNQKLLIVKMIKTKKI